MPRSITPTPVPLRRARTIVTPALAAAAFVLTGCGGEVRPGEPVGAVPERIQGGYDDGSDHGVVGLAITGDTGKAIRACSGSLIAPNLVLTAQHCISKTAKFVVCDSSSFGPPVSPEHVYVTPSESMWSSGASWVQASEVHTPPGGDGVCGRDVALVILKQAIATDAARPIVPRLDRYVAPGEAYSAIGYGATGEGTKDAGLRRRRDGLEIDCVGNECGQASEIDGAAPEWKGKVGICNGDSGGPAVDADGHVIGVTSRGPTGCDDPVYGGLTGWRDWVREKATHASQIGGYTPPPWLIPTALEGDYALESHGSAAGACAVRAGSARGLDGGAAAIALAGLAFAAGVRRSRQPRGASSGATARTSSPPKRDT